MAPLGFCTLREQHRTTGARKQQPQRHQVTTGSKIRRVSSLRFTCSGVCRLTADRSIGYCLYRVGFVLCSIPTISSHLISSHLPLESNPCRFNQRRTDTAAGASWQDTRFPCHFPPLGLVLALPPPSTM